jgi:hypothetical protein
VNRDFEAKSQRPHEEDDRQLPQRAARVAPEALEALAARVAQPPAGECAVLRLGSHLADAPIAHGSVLAGSTYGRQRSGYSKTGRTRRGERSAAASKRCTQIRLPASWNRRRVQQSAGSQAVPRLIRIVPEDQARAARRRRMK